MNAGEPLDRLQVGWAGSHRVAQRRVSHCRTLPFVEDANPTHAEARVLVSRPARPRLVRLKLALFRLAASRPSVYPAPRQKSLQPIFWAYLLEALGELGVGGTVDGTHRQQEGKTLLEASWSKRLDRSTVRTLNQTYFPTEKSTG